MSSVSQSGRESGCVVGPCQRNTSPLYEQLCCGPCCVTGERQHYFRQFKTTLNPNLSICINITQSICRRYPAASNHTWQLPSLLLRLSCSSERQNTKHCSPSTQQSLRTEQTHRPVLPPTLLILNLSYISCPSANTLST